MARVFSPRILLLVTLYVILNIKCEEHCETRDLRALLQHVRQLEKEFKTFKDSTIVELKELNITMTKELDKLRKRIQQTTTTAMTTPSSSVPSLSSATSVTSTPTPVSTTIENIPCPEGWERNGSSCYYYTINHGLYFDEAQEFCTNRSAILVHVNDAAENDFLKSFIERSHVFWIGLKSRASDKTWRWIDDNTVAEFTDWASGQPDGGECGFAHYGQVYGWSDASCSGSGFANPLCEKGLS